MPMPPSQPVPRTVPGATTQTRHGQYQALATDYDGTLAKDGLVTPETLAALDRARRAGLKLVLVTGRELDDLMRVFPELDQFDVVVAENGALLYTPGATPRERPLSRAPSPELARVLAERGVEPLSCGRIIVATREPFQHVVLETIRDLGLELEVIFNKGAVMVLPSGVNKATGLEAAAAELGLRLPEIVGVGDAENDHSLLEGCGLGVAVANAVPALKDRADLVTAGARGEGVAELIDRILATDLAGVRRRGRPGTLHAVTPPESERG